MNSKPTGRAKGGIARAKSLSPEQRSKIALKAARTRWGEKPIKATHRGNFKEEFGFDVDCYVLDDEQKTAVISQRGMGTALGASLTSTGTWIQRFIKGKKIKSYIGSELEEKLKKPIRLQLPSPGPKTQFISLNCQLVSKL